MKNQNNKLRPIIQFWAELCTYLKNLGLTLLSKLKSRLHRDTIWRHQYLLLSDDLTLRCTFWNHSEIIVQLYARWHTLAQAHLTPASYSSSTSFQTDNLRSQSWWKVVCLFCKVVDSVASASYIRLVLHPFGFHLVLAR